MTYVPPKVPTLYSALSTGVSASNASIYGANTNAFILKKNDVVEIVLNNNDPGKHPFHLHGHTFQAVVRSNVDAGPYTGNATLPAVPMRRDTFMVQPNGNIVLRFRADNPDKSPPPLDPLPLLKWSLPSPQNLHLPRTRLALPLPHRMARGLRPHSHHDRITLRPPILPLHPRRPPRRLPRPQHPHRRQRSRQYRRSVRPQRRKYIPPATTGRIHGERDSGVGV